MDRRITSAGDGQSGETTGGGPRPGGGRRVLIAGCGYVGAELARRLVRDGVEVTGLGRRADAPLEGIGWIRGDLARPETLAPLRAGAFDAVVFAASPSSPDEAGYRRIFVEGLGNLIDALAGASPAPERLLFTASTAVYGQSGGEWVDEDSPTEPPRYNGRILLQAEQVLHAAPFTTVSLRLGGIYGPGRTRLIDQVRRGDARLDPGPAQYTNRIHRNDAAGALRHLLQVAAPKAVYLGVDSEPAARNDVTQFMAERLGVPCPPVADAPAPRRAGSKRCRNASLLGSGYGFEYPSFREGYGEMIAGG